MGFWWFWCSLVGACTLTAAERTLGKARRRPGLFETVFLIVPLVTLVHAVLVLLTLHLGKVLPVAGLFLLLILAANYVIQVSRIMKLSILGEK